MYHYVCRPKVKLLEAQLDFVSAPQRFRSAEATFRAIRELSEQQRERGKEWDEPAWNTGSQRCFLLVHLTYSYSCY